MSLDVLYLGRFAAWTLCLWTFCRCTCCTVHRFVQSAVLYNVLWCTMRHVIQYNVLYSAPSCTVHCVLQVPLVEWPECLFWPIMKVVGSIFGRINNIFDIF